MPIAGIAFMRLKIGIPFIDPHPRSKSGDGFVSRHFNRWISAPISELLLRTRVTPNQVTLGIALFTIPMVIAGAYGHLLAVSIFWQLASALDGIDGEISRAKNLGSRFGALLDTILDYTVDSVGVLAIGLALLAQATVPFGAILFTVSITIGARLITNFVVKSLPKQHCNHLLPETRDIIVLLVLFGAIATRFTSGWVMLSTLLFISAVRFANCLYRMIRYYMTEGSVE